MSGVMLISTDYLPYTFWTTCHLNTSPNRTLGDQPLCTQMILLCQQIIRPCDYLTNFDHAQKIKETK